MYTTYRLFGLSSYVGFRGIILGTLKHDKLLEMAANDRSYTRIK
jgi:hypothetical protein